MNKDEASYRNAIIAGILALVFLALLIAGILYCYKALSNNMIDRTVTDVKTYVEMKNSEDN